jgi:hypothetical protein
MVAMSSNSNVACPREAFEPKEQENGSRVDGLKGHKCPLQLLHGGVWVEIGDHNRASILVLGLLLPLLLGRPAQEALLMLHSVDFVQQVKGACFRNRIRTHSTNRHSRPRGDGCSDE